MIFIHSMLVLILIHRDYYPNVPLFLHIHSTEQVEHLYGCSRAETKAYTFVQFLLGLPKTLLLMQGQASSPKGAQAASSAHRVGYEYSWWKMPKIDLASMCRHPNNAAFERQMCLAWGDSSSLLSTLGMIPVSPRKYIELIMEPADFETRLSPNELCLSGGMVLTAEQEAHHADASKLVDMLLANDGSGRLDSKSETEIANLVAAAAALFMQENQDV
jgi:hypothetical protein